ncbi:MAG: hypothetical protein ACPGLV_17695, partial [Bacteroidia bacterium]
SVTKNIAGAYAGFFDRSKTEQFLRNRPLTQREKLDEYRNFLNDNQIPLSEEQQKNLKRSVAFELSAETLPAFSADL